MSDEQFRQMCNVYGFAPSRALREMMDAVAGQAVIAERNACAKVAEETVCDTHLPTGVNVYGSRAAAAIRARGQQ